MNNETVMTSVKVEKELYDQFKNRPNKTKFYLQDLVNRSMRLYLTDENFRKLLEESALNIVSNGNESFSLTTPNNG